MRTDDIGGIRSAAGAFRHWGDISREELAGVLVLCSQADQADCMAQPEERDRLIDEARLFLAAVGKSMELEEDWEEERP